MLVVQGMLVTEMWMDRVARMTGQPLQSIRQLNLYKEKERTHFGQILHGSQIQVAPLVLHLPLHTESACSSNGAIGYACRCHQCKCTFREGVKQGRYSAYSPDKTLVRSFRVVYAIS